MSIPHSRLTPRAKFILYVDYWSHNLKWELNQDTVDKLADHYFGAMHNDSPVELTEQATIASKQKKSKK